MSILENETIKKVAVEIIKLIDKWKYEYNLSNEDVVTMLDYIIQIKKDQLIRDSIFVKQVVKTAEVGNKKESNLLNFTIKRAN